MDDYKHDSYKFDGEESRVHFDRRTLHGRVHKVKVRVATELLVLFVGVALASIAAGMAWTVAVLHGQMSKLIDVATTSGGSAHDERNLGAGFGVYLGSRVLLVTLAAVLTYKAPFAANSGLPKIKSFLNGTHIRGGLFSLRTFFAKTIGITCVVATGLPLGREGPMVHIGAMVAAQATRVGRLIGGGSSDPLLELRLPSQQRAWIGMGAAAGVAAAFNAPFGGILYSFEEVCSKWTAALTWRSFCCALVVTSVYTFYVEYSGGRILAGFLTDGGVHARQSYLLFNGGELHMVILLGVVGGIVGALYNTIVFTLSSVRTRLHRVMPRMRQSRCIEAIVTSIIVFALYYWVPVAFGCTPCPPTSNLSTVGLHGARMRRLSAAGSSCHFSEHDEFHKHHPYLQHHCAYGEYSEMATLFLSSQESLLNHLLTRSPANDDAFSVATLGISFALYFILASFSFGIALPAGNFVPGIAIGGLLGRLVGRLFLQWGVALAWSPGTYALIGAAAVLSGMTRMSLTLAAILVETADDSQMMLTLMLVLAVARISGAFIARAFDEGMMENQQLPFLEEAPPQGLSMLTARNAMATPVKCLPEVVKVGNLIKVLDSCTHNGFPVVRIKENQKSDKQMLAGLVLRRQLLVLLKGRVWIEQASSKGLSQSLAHGFLSSFDSDIDSIDSLGNPLPVEAILGVYTTDEKQQLIDLRSFIDPSPFIVRELMTLERVYRLFNEIGVRHLPVCSEANGIVGIITRKDLNLRALERAIVSLSQATKVAPAALSSKNDDSESKDGTESKDGLSSEGERNVAVTETSSGDEEPLAEVLDVQNDSYTNEQQKIQTPYLRRASNPAILPSNPAWKPSMHPALKNSKGLRPYAKHKVTKTRGSGLPRQQELEA